MKGFIEQVIEIKKELIGEYKRLLDFNKYLKDELSRKEIFRVKRKLEKELKIIKDRVEDNAKCSSNYVKRFSKKKE